VPDLESRKVDRNRTSPGFKPDMPYVRKLRAFRLRSGPVGGWGADVPRTLGEAEPRTTKGGVSGRFMGTQFPRPGSDDADVEARIQDMDEEGVDVQLLVNSGGPGGHENGQVNVEFMQAQHRYLDDFCGKYPHRLKSMIAVNTRYVEESAQEIRRWGRSKWAVGVYLNLPIDYPLDHPDLHPIWQALDETGLCYIHHSFSQGYPGYRDLWTSPFMGRLASHPWAAMRAVAAFVGAGIMDRVPEIRYGILESGFGWLPFWAKRMDDQAVYMGHVAENLEYQLSEYLTGGRFFAAIVTHEGPEMAKMVTDLMGDHILMYGSDYPHPESRFPETADNVLAWDTLSEGQMRKLMWDNAVRFFGEP
jgi:predicted TIM-barrel fold metal-dependent hydrolase